MDQTDFLVGRPSFAEGIGRMFDFAGALDVYEVSPTSADADARAIRSDFALVGQDIQGAMDGFQAPRTP